MLAVCMRRMAAPGTSPFSFKPPGPICAVHNSSVPVTAMLTLFVYFARRKRAFVWSPAVDLSDPYVAAALVPTMNS
jgi:hypothetical protein